MKVFQLTVHFSPNVGGVETHQDDLVYGLAKLGHQVMVLTYQPLVAKTSWETIERKDNLTIVRLPWFPGFFYQLVHNPILEFAYLVPGLFLATPFFLLFNRPEVIHAHGLVAGFIGVFWGKVFNIRIVVSTHSLYHFPQSGLYHKFSKWIFQNASKTICLSDQSVEEVVRLGVNRKKVSRFTYWVDQELFKPQDKNKLKKNLKWQNKFVVLFVGRLVEIKGIRELIEATKMLSDKYLVVIAGDGPLKPEVEKAAKNSKGRIQFLGRISNVESAMYYAGADLVIVPSTHDEGFGRVILEALSSGTPVIGSNRGAIPEAMDNSVGEIINVTVENIVDSIVRLTSNMKKLDKFSENAHKFAQKRYSSQNLIELIKNYK